MAKRGGRGAEEGAGCHVCCQLGGGVVDANIMGRAVGVAKGLVV